MKVEEIYRQVFEISKQYERESNSAQLKENLLKIAQIVQRDTNIYGSFSYSLINANQPVMGIFYQGSDCLSFTFGDDKLFYSYNGKSRVVQSTKTTMRELPRMMPKVSNGVSETPAIKVEFAPKEITKMKIPAPCDCEKCKMKRRRHRHSRK
jgi:hypothetical protein